MLAELEACPELIDGYIALKAESGLSSKTIQNHLLLLNVMLRRAVVWRLIRSNPVSSIDRPSLVQPEMSVLTETEIGRLANAYDELVAEASEAERPWWSLAKAIVLTALGTAMRRGELVGLRWRSVNLLEAKIDVRETFVRGRFTTPKSRASRRVVELGPRTLAVLEEQWRSSAYRGDDDLVFGHPTKGTPVDTEQAREALPEAGARACRNREAVPPLPRPPPHLSDARCGGGQPADLRSGAGGPLARLDHRALHARRPGPLPGRGREERGADVRRSEQLR